MNSKTSNKLLSDIVAFRTYAKYLQHLQRRETLEETINRSMNMHLEKFPKLSKDIVKAFSRVHELKVMGSMRASQFAGDAILKNNARIFNCSYAPIEDTRIFSEALFLLLSGVGFGFSVQSKHVAKLPKVIGPKEDGMFYVVHDSIQGWAEALNQLIEAYFHGKIKPTFDFGNIRPKGSYLVTTGAKAPGPEPLKHMLQLVDEKLKAAIGRKLRPIEVHDLVCIISDSVLAGGIRRSALISLFDYGDNEMLLSKSGSWWEKHPYRARANNSVILNRKAVTKKQFMEVFNACKNSGSGEPGIYFTNDESMDYGTNPCCLTGDSLIAVADGRNAVQIKDLVGTVYDVYTIKDGRVTIGRAINTIKTKENAEVWKLTLDDGSIVKATNDHKFMLRNGEYKMLMDLKPGDSLMPFNSYLSNNRYRQIASNTGRDRRQYRMIAEHNGLIVDPKTTAIHHSDFNSLNDNINNLIAMPHNEHKELHSKNMRGLNNSVFKIKNREKWLGLLAKNSTGLNNSTSTGKTNQEIFDYVMKKTIDHGAKMRLEDYVHYAKKDGFPTSFSNYRKKELGSITFLLEAVAIILNSDFAPTLPSQNLNEQHYKTREEKLRNQISAQSKAFSKRKEKTRILQANIFNDLRISKASFSKKDWIDECKRRGVSPEISRKSSPFKSYEDLKDFASNYNHRVLKVEYFGREDVYDIEVEGTHNFAVISSAKDANFIESSGVFVHNCEISLQPYQFCNLSTINQTGIKDEKDFMNRVYAATLIGTLQASYTDFHYLSPRWKNATEQDSLLGVSFTGIADGGVKPSLLESGAKFAKEVNLKYADKIGTNPAARITCVKPEGSSSTILGSSSGIHARHSQYYIRRIRMNKADALAVYLKSVVPDLVEDDKFSSGGVVVSIPQMSPEGSILRESESALDLFHRTIMYNNKWIVPGHTSGPNHHNVSVTLSVKDNEWDELGEEMWKHRDSFHGISLLPYDGGTYIQAPFESFTKEQYEHMSSLVRDVDLTQVKEEDDKTSRGETVACAGGACLIE